MVPDPADGWIVPLSGTTLSLICSISGTRARGESYGRWPPRSIAPQGPGLLGCNRPWLDTAPSFRPGAEFFCSTTSVYELQSQWLLLTSVDSTRSGLELRPDSRKAANPATKSSGQGGFISRSLPNDTFQETSAVKCLLTMAHWGCDRKHPMKWGGRRQQELGFRFAELITAGRQRQTIKYVCAKVARNNCRTAHLHANAGVRRQRQRHAVPKALGRAAQPLFFGEGTLRQPLPDSPCTSAGWLKHARLLSGLHHPPQQLRSAWCRAFEPPVEPVNPGQPLRRRAHPR